MGNNKLRSFKLKVRNFAIEHKEMDARKFLKPQGKLNIEIKTKWIFLIQILLVSNHLQSLADSVPSAWTTLCSHIFANLILFDFLSCCWGICNMAFIRSEVGKGGSKIS